jgi:hypothetical protein
MNQEKLWFEFSTLPPHAQKLVIEFITFLQKCYNQLGVFSDTPNLTNEPLPYVSRVGWDEQFKSMAQAGDDQLFDVEVALTEWDETEWIW